MEELGGLQSTGRKESDTTERLHFTSLIDQLVKNLPASAGNIGLIHGLGRYPGEGNGNPLQYSYLENPMDRETWLGYSPWGRKESDTTE